MRPSTPTIAHSNLTDERELGSGLADFGVVLQGSMAPSERRQIGAHYTGEADIMKVLRGTFLDALELELAAALTLEAGRAKHLARLHDQIAKLEFFDPACGCGNFLVLAYRELRRIEQAIVVALHEAGAHATTDIQAVARVSMQQFHGIELFERPVELARTELCAMEQHMDRRLAAALGRPFRRSPVGGAAHILCGNALDLDWASVVTPSENLIIIGNPPFVGKKEQSAQQKQDLLRIFRGVKGAGILDYVACWYAKAAELMRGTRSRCTFVSTNSITQGEQVAVLWRHLLARGMKIHLAHQTFVWTSDARGIAHVHVIIVGFAAFDSSDKTLFAYEHGTSEPTSTKVANINPYLVAGPDWVASARRRPLHEDVPRIAYGSMMIDKPRSAGEAAGLTFGLAHREILLRQCPALAPYVRPLVGGEEFIQGTQRWCLWLVDASAAELTTFISTSAELRGRIDGVRAFRLASGRAQTRSLAATPARFGEIRQPSGPYLLIPKVSSETRRTLPIGFMPASVIASGSALIIPDADHHHFGILSSSMHNAWLRAVAGRMKSDYQYSSGIVYNNFVWPRAVSARRRAGVVEASKAVLATRERHGEATLAVLYDPLSMPADLLAAHQRLDRAVERCYREQPFPTDHERAEFLFEQARSLVPDF
jgi:hypothetical protein